MKPITRKEYYIAKAAGTYTGPTPAPVLREDYYLATLAGDYSGNCPAPVTRLEKYMSAAAGLTSYVPQPVTRIEKYWYAIAKGTGYVPEPVTREEQLLYAIIHKEPQYIDKTAEGSTILLTDSAEASFTAFTIYGHSTQSGTPSPDNPVPIVSAGDEGEINVEVLGGNLADISQVVNIGGSSCVQISDTGFSFTYSEKESNTRLNRIPCKLKAGKQYICAAELSSNYIQAYLPETEQYFGFGQTFTPNEDVNYIIVYVNVGDPYDTYTVEYFIVNVGDTALSWEPYKTPQILTLSTPNGLPGIPVSSGGNYTDENGQQWVCDEIDLARGKYVKRVGTETINGGYNLSERPEFPGIFEQFSVFTNLYKNGAYEAFCNIALWYEWASNKDATAWKFAISSSGYYLNPPTASGITTADELNAFLNSLGFPLVFAGQLETPIETDLPAEEIVAYKALHTYSPTTTVSNDAAAWMEVGYKATP